MDIQQARRRLGRNKEIDSMIHIEDLPPVAQQIATVSGVNAAVAFCRRFGGISVSIPVHYSPGCLLCRELGERPARDIISLFGGRSLPVPRMEALMRKIRDENIRGDRASGMSHNALAARYGLTARTIYRVLRNDE
jgi:hypothetical protein